MCPPGTETGHVSPRTVKMVVLTGAPGIVTRCVTSCRNTKIHLQIINVLKKSKNITLQKMFAVNKTEYFQHFCCVEIVYITCILEIKKKPIYLELRLREMRNREARSSWFEDKFSAQALTPMNKVVFIISHYIKIRNITIPPWSICFDLSLFDIFEL